MIVMPGQKAKYDAWNRLVEMKNSSDGLLVKYEYNGLNHRVKKTVGGVLTTSFFNKDWQELESMASSTTSVYIWGQRYIDDLVLREKGTEKLYSLADPNWNVVTVIDDSGVVQERMRYDAFGQVTWMSAAFATKTNSAYTWNRTFTGQIHDCETELMLYRNRFYHTGLGRFVTRDPIGYEGNDANLFRYVKNLPLLYTDPDGKSILGICTIVILGVVVLSASGCSATPKPPKPQPSKPESPKPDPKPSPRPSPPSTRRSGVILPSVPTARPMGPINIPPNAVPNSLNPIPVTLPPRQPSDCPQ